MKPEEAVKIAQEWLAKYGPEHAKIAKINWQFVRA
jgi:hypothetical protein